MDFPYFTILPTVTNFISYRSIEYNYCVFKIIIYKMKVKKLYPIEYNYCVFKILIYKMKVNY